MKESSKDAYHVSDDLPWMSVLSIELEMEKVVCQHGEKAAAVVIGGDLMGL